MYKNRAGLVTIVEPRGNDKATWKNAKQKVDAQFQQRLWQQGNTKQWSRDLRLFFLLGFESILDPDNSNSVSKSYLLIYDTIV